MRNTASSTRSAAIALSAASILAAAGVRAAGTDFARGVDISSLPRVEAAGGVFTEGGVPGDALGILAGQGVNFVRLRLWHSPPDGYCGLERTAEMAARAKELGLGVLLDLHYSDVWADPGRQGKPAAWEGLTSAELADSVYSYTRDVVETLVARNAAPDWVQTGNEISCGMLWDDGRVCGRWDDRAHWKRLASLVRAGIAGVRDASGDDGVMTMIHFDDGGDNEACARFYDALIAEGVEFDLIGLSFYPWWHGTFDDLSRNLRDLASRYGKGIVIVETSYPFTLGWNDDTHNIIGLESQLLGGYPADTAGQEAFISSLVDSVACLPGGLGTGVFYWEPAWISAPASGSPVENMALFGFDGELLGSASAFGRAGGGHD